MDELLWVFAGFLSFIILLSGCSLLYMFLRAMRFSGPGAGAGPGDFSNMMILFQSMRETLDQQKELARNFNYSIDKKVADIRKTIEGAGDLTARVAKAEQELNALVSDAKEELASVKRRLEYLQEQIPGFEAEASDDVPKPIKDKQIEGTLGELSESIAALDEKPVASESDQVASVDVEETQEAIEEEVIEHQIPSVMDAQGNVVPYDGTKKLPPLHAIASAPAPKRDLIDNWTGVDFGVNTPAPEPAKIAEIDEPEDPEASREAFRELLSMKTSPNQDVLGDEPADAGKDLSPTQRRVYEFSDAGMKVSEIARELGMGKGEVKLMLNMRNKG